VHNFIVFSHRNSGKSLQQIQNLCSILHRSAGQLSNYEWVAQNFSSIEKDTQFVVAMTKMINPNPSINERHYVLPAAAEYSSASFHFRQGPPTDAHSPSR